jgi:hypothetical protein
MKNLCLQHLVFLKQVITETTKDRSTMKHTLGSHAEVTNSAICIQIQREISNVMDSNLMSNT